MKPIIFYIAMIVCVFTYFPGQVTAQEFVYVRGNHAAVGRFDEYGEFIRNGEYDPYKYSTVSGYAFFKLSSDFDQYWESQSVVKNRKCYEFRSGFLIAGSMQCVDNVYFFVPEKGSEICKYVAKTFANDFRIYNFTPSIRANSNGIGQDLRQFNVHKDGIIYKKLPPPEGFVLCKQKAGPIYKKYIKTYNGELEFGELDEYGVFCPDYSVPVIPKLPFDIKYKQIDDCREDIYLQFNLAQNGKDEEPVFEFRADRLIPGVLKGDTGRFVPTEGKKVIGFSDYRVGKDPRIYNLPGILVKKK